VSREEAEVRLNVATATAQLLEDLVEIERLTRPSAGQHNPQEVRDLKAKLEKATIEQQEAQRRLDLLTNARPGHR
jgi:hypothetical protein